VKFIEKYPDEVPRIVALALEAAAAREGTDDATLVRTLPEALRRLIVPARTDDKAARVLSISEAAELLDVTRVTIYAWIEAKRLLAWRVTRRGMLIPAEQIVGPGEIVPGIERVLGVISEPAAAWDFLTEESPYIDPNALRRPIDALKAGDVDAVAAAAHSFLDTFT
jgi:excisionase family DNA binding protein